jgi:hypothetical protein
MEKNSTKPRIFIHLIAFWGNDDVDATIKVSRRRWKAIQEGAEYVTSGSYWYEGKKFYATWSFAEGKVTITGDDGMECVINEPVGKLL